MVAMLGKQVKLVPELSIYLKLPSGNGDKRTCYTSGRHDDNEWTTAALGIENESLDQSSNILYFYENEEIDKIMLMNETVH